MNQPVEDVLYHSICNECAFHIQKENLIQCIHPDEFDINCAAVTFCNSFQPAVEIDSPCVSFGQDAEKTQETGK